MLRARCTLYIAPDHNGPLAQHEVMQYEIPQQLVGLIPVAILERVQNGLDTTLSELEAEGKVKWSSKVSNKSFTIRRKQTEKFSRKDADGVFLNPAEEFLHYLITLGNLQTELGNFDVKVPAGIRDWFIELASREAEKA